VSWHSEFNRCQTKSACLTESAARKLKYLVWWQISNTRGELAIDMEVLHDGYSEHRFRNCITSMQNSNDYNSKSIF